MCVRADAKNIRYVCVSCKKTFDISQRLYPRRSRTLGCSISSPLRRKFCESCWRVVIINAINSKTPTYIYALKKLGDLNKMLLKVKGAVTVEAYNKLSPMRV